MVVASRLSKAPSLKTLLLYTGSDKYSDSDVPLLAKNLRLGSFGWQDRVETQPGEACLGMRNEQGKRC